MSYPPGPPEGEPPENNDPPNDPASQPPQPGYPPQNPYGQPPYDQPQYGQPGYGQPPYGQVPYGQPGYGQPQYEQPGYGYGQPPTTNGKATASLITGITSVVLAFCCIGELTGIVAIVLGVKARAEIRATGGQQGGDGMALGGIVTGVVAIVLGLAIIVLFAVAIANGDGSFTTNNGEF